MKATMILVDPSMFVDKPTTITRWTSGEGTTITELRDPELLQLVERVEQLFHDSGGKDSCLVLADGAGVGGGVVSALRERGIRVGEARFGKWHWQEPRQGVLE